MFEAIRIEKVTPGASVAERARAHFERVAPEHRDALRVIVAGEALARALGYSTTEQLAKARERGRLPVAVSQSGPGKPLEADGRELLSRLDLFAAPDTLRSGDLLEFLGATSDEQLANIWRRGQTPLCRLEDGSYAMLAEDASAFAAGPSLRALKKRLAARQAGAA